MAYSRRTRTYRRRTGTTTRKARLVRRMRVARQYRYARRTLRRRTANRQRAQVRYCRFYTNDEHSYINTNIDTYDVFTWGNLANPSSGRSVKAIQTMAAKYGQFKTNLVVVKITPVATQIVSTSTTDYVAGTPHKMVGCVLPNASARNNDGVQVDYGTLMNLPGAKSVRYGKTLTLFIRPSQYVFNGLQNTSLGSNTIKVASQWQDTAMLLKAPPGGADYLGSYTYCFDQHTATAERLLIEYYFYCSFKGERSALFTPS